MEFHVDDKEALSYQKYNNPRYNHNNDKDDEFSNLSYRSFDIFCLNKEMIEIESEKIKKNCIDFVPFYYIISSVIYILCQLYAVWVET